MFGQEIQHDLFSGHPGGKQKVGLAAAQVGVDETARLQLETAPIDRTSEVRFHAPLEEFSSSLNVRERNPEQLVVWLVNIGTGTVGGRVIR